MNDGVNTILSEAEREALRQAYLRGATGHLLIGLRGTKRIVTMLLPKASTQAAAAQQMTRNAAKLKAMHCDGYIYVGPEDFDVGPEGFAAPEDFAAPEGFARLQGSL